VPSPTPSLTTAAARDLIRETAFPGTTGSSVGLEIEWFTSPSRSPRSVAELRTLLEPHLPLPHRSLITFEPGGQLELSSRVMGSCGAAVNAVGRDTNAVRAALKPHGIELTANGIDPHRPLRLCTDEQRYVSMKAYFDGANHAGAHMMCTTAAVHVNVDAGSDAAGSRRWKLAHQIGPMLVAAFANSPIVQGRPSGWLSSRMGAWLAIDSTRSKPALNGADPRDAWASYALRANVMFLRTQPRYRPLQEPLTFESWINDGHELGHPTAEDLAYHLTTLFPPVRPRGWLELRMIDMVPDPWWRVAAAVTTALVCHDKASAIADEATKDTADMWYEAARYGLRHPLMRDSAQKCFGVAIEALDDIGSDQKSSSAASDYFDHYVSRGRCPADDQLESWNTNADPTTGEDE
jgi:glutamate--cysteine ligase